MRHRISFNRLDRRAGQRKALLKNALTSLFIHERIKTTKAKALEIRRFAEKMVSRAKVDSVHNRRIVGKVITERGVLAKLFTDIAPRYSQRPGGYTRVLKIGRRKGDAAEMVILELVESEVAEEKREQRRRRKAEKAEKEEQQRIETEKLEEEKEQETAEAPEESVKADPGQMDEAEEAEEAEEKEDSETPAKK